MTSSSIHFSHNFIVQDGRIKFYCTHTLHFLYPPRCIGWFHILALNMDMQASLWYVGLESFGGAGDTQEQSGWLLWHFYFELPPYQFPQCLIWLLSFPGNLALALLLHTQPAMCQVVEEILGI